MKALEGIRVIDFTQAMAAPFGTMNLADMGADVIKIEPPGTGEPTRELSADRAERPQRHVHDDEPRQARAHASTSSGRRASRSSSAWRRRPTSSSRTTAPAWPSAWASATRRCPRVNPRLDLLLGQRLRRHRSLRPARRLRPDRAGHERDHQRDGRRGRAGQIGRADHRSLCRTLRRLRHPLRARVSRADGPRASSSTPRCSRRPWR